MLLGATLERELCGLYAHSLGTTIRLPSFAEQSACSGGSGAAQHAWKNRITIAVNLLLPGHIANCTIILATGRFASILVLLWADIDLRRLCFAIKARKKCACAKGSAGIYNTRPPLYLDLLVDDKHTEQVNSCFSHMTIPNTKSVNRETLVWKISLIRLVVYTNDSFM